jgi:hypothetical protein
MISAAASVRVERGLDCPTRDRFLLPDRLGLRFADGGVPVMAREPGDGRKDGILPPMARGGVAGAPGLPCTGDCPGEAGHAGDRIATRSSCAGESSTFDIRVSSFMTRFSMRSQRLPRESDRESLTAKLSRSACTMPPSPTVFDAAATTTATHITSATYLGSALG